MTPSLYTIGTEFAAIEAELYEAGGEITPEIEVRLLDLGALEGEKVDGLATVVRTFESHATACRHEAAAFTVKATVAETAAKRLKARLLDYLTDRGLEELRGTIWKAKRTANGGKQAMTLLVDASELPPEYQVLTVTAYTEGLRLRADDDGVVVLRGVPIARLEPRGHHLRIS